MTPKSIVRRPRTYRSELRQRQAEATRSRILISAAELFAIEGYARTTLAKIAAAAGVSTETVAGQGPKVALLIAAIEYAAFGVAGEEDVGNLDVGRELLAIDDRDAALDFVAAMVVEVHQRNADLTQALLGADDPELDRYRSEVFAGIKRQSHRVLERFRERGWVRTDVAFDELVDTADMLCSIVTYLWATVRNGWSPATYQAWLRRMLAETVFAR